MRFTPTFLKSLSTIAAVMLSKVTTVRSNLGSIPSIRNLRRVVRVHTHVSCYYVLQHSTAQHSTAQHNTTQQLGLH
jgi:hypothetical protein